VTRIHLQFGLAVALTMNCHGCLTLTLNRGEIVTLAQGHCGRLIVTGVYQACSPRLSKTNADCSASTSDEDEHRTLLSARPNEFPSSALLLPSHLRQFLSHTTFSRKCISHFKLSAVR